MKLAFSTLGCPHYSLDQAISAAAEYGYDGVELRALDGTVDLSSLPDFASSRLSASARKFEDAAIHVAGLGTSALLTDGFEGEAAKQLDVVRRAVDLAVGIAAPLIRVFAGTNEGQRLTDAARHTIAQRVTRAAEIARGSGVMVCVETHGTLSAARDLRGVFEAGIADDVGILWDAMHTYNAGEEIAASYATLAPRVRHVHLRDARGLRPLQHRYVATGEGDMPLGEVLAAVSSEYSGYLSFEWEKFWHPEIAEPEVAFPQFVSAMRHLAATQQAASTTTPV